MEELLSRGWHVPMVNKAMIDEDDFLRLIDQMRISMPQEIKQAQQIQQEREQIISQAQERAEHIVALARDQSERLVGEHELQQRAQEEREAVLAEARKEAEKIRAEADHYAIQVLEDLDRRLDNFRSTVRNGIDMLNDRMKPAEEPEPEEESSPEPTSQS